MKKEDSQKKPAPTSLNMDEMTANQLHEKLQKGLCDAELGRVRDAKEEFGWLTEKN